MINELIPIFIAALKNGEWFIVLAISVGVIIYNVPQIFDFFDRQRNKRWNDINKDLKHNAITEDTRAILEDELNSISIKRATGIDANKVFIKKASEIISKSGGSIDIHQIRLAREYMTINEGEIVVDISGRHYLMLISYKILSILSILFSLPLFFLPTFIVNLSIYQYFIVFMVGIIFLLLAFFLAKQAIPYFIAQKIDLVLKQVQK